MADSKIDDGGPAFFHGPDPHDPQKATQGLTVRDWFAGQALAGLAGNPGGPYQANDWRGWGIVNCDVSDIAAECYEMADAMIAARKAEGRS